MEVQSEVQTNAPICKTQNCKRPLTYLEKQGCWRCLTCNPIPKDTSKPKEKKKFLDVAMKEERVVEMIKEALEKGAITYIAIGKSTRPETMGIKIDEGRIREIVQDELMNWHIQKPPVTREDYDALIDAPLKEHFDKPADTYSSTARDEIAEATSEGAPVEKPETWLQIAKRLGVRTHNEGTGGMRKKVDIIADVERIQDGGTSSTQD